MMAINGTSILRRNHLDRQLATVYFSQVESITYAIFLRLKDEYVYII